MKKKKSNEDNYITQMRFLEKIPYFCLGFCLINQLIVFINTKNLDKLLVCFYIMMIIAMHWISVQERRMKENSIKWRDDFINLTLDAIKSNGTHIELLNNKIDKLKKKNEKIVFKKRWKIK